MSGMNQCAVCGKWGHDGTESHTLLVFALPPEEMTGPMQRSGVLGKYLTADQLKAQADVIGLLRTSLQNVLEHLADEHQCTDWQAEENLLRRFADPAHLADRLL